MLYRLVFTRQRPPTAVGLLPWAGEHYEIRSRAITYDEAHALREDAAKRGLLGEWEVRIEVDQPTGGSR